MAGATCVTPDTMDKIPEHKGLRNGRDRLGWRESDTTGGAPGHAELRRDNTGPV